MTKPTKKANSQYIEVGYKDKVVFTSRTRKRGVAKPQTKSRANLIDIWQKSQGLWADHPVFRGMNAKGIIEWLRGDDADV